MAGELGPVVARVRRFVEPATRPLDGTVHAPRRPVRVPHRGIDHLRILRRQRQIHRPDFRTFVEHLPPGVSAVRRAVHAALRVGSVGVTERHHINRVRIPRIDADRPNLPRVAQADISPGLAAVHGLVDAVADSKIGPDVGLAGAHINHVGVRRRHGDGSDGGDALLVEDRHPHRARVGSLPDPATHGPEIERVRIARNSRHRDHAPGAKRPDQPPLESIEETARKRLCSRNRTQQAHCKRTDFHTLPGMHRGYQICSAPLSSDVGQDGILRGGCQPPPSLDDITVI